MLRIAKSSPGILDLSAVKDEHGLPVTLNGASYRDVPDHEEDNPVLQRVRAMQWVTVTKVPLAPSLDEASVPAEEFPQDPATQLVIEAEPEPPPVMGHEPATETSPAVEHEPVTEPEPEPAKPSTKKSSRRT